MKHIYRKHLIIPCLGVLLLLAAIWKFGSPIDPRVSVHNVQENTNLAYHTETDLKQILKYIPSPYVNQVNCRAIAQGDEKEIKKAEAYQAYQAYLPYYNGITHKIEDCSSFIKQRQYTIKALNQEEAEFPLAFSLIMHQDPEMAERLLRAVYRPQNYYCVHIDKKASNKTFAMMKSVVRCFDNVFLLPEAINVIWGQFTILVPEFKCMEQLWKYKKWKYFINLTGQEFPLQTNLHLVKILKTIKGAHIAEGTVRRHNKERTAHKKPFHANITIAKGAVHVAVSRKFIDYVLHNKTALEFREWVKDTGHPEEIFFSSLIHSPQLGVPGAYKGEPEINAATGNPFLIRVKHWAGTPLKCHGMYAKGICIFGIGDLRYLINRKEMVANKFYKNYHPLVYDCLEEIHYNNTRQELLGTRTFNESYYKALDIVHNHVD